jgi:hypothetical protein
MCPQDFVCPEGLFLCLPAGLRLPRRTLVFGARRTSSAPEDCFDWCPQVFVCPEGLFCLVLPAGLRLPRRALCFSARRTFCVASFGRVRVPDDASASLVDFQELEVYFISILRINLC